jgi:hypothetical protein
MHIFTEVIPITVPPTTDKFKIPATDTAGNPTGTPEWGDSAGGGNGTITPNDDGTYTLVVGSFVGVGWVSYGSTVATQLPTIFRVTPETGVEVNVQPAT